MNQGRLASGSEEIEADDGKDPIQPHRLQLLENLRPAMFVAGAVLWVIAPIAGLGWIAIQDRNAAFVEIAPAWVPVTQSTGTVSSTVDVGLAWRPADILTAPAWSGTVQNVFVEAGSSITSGTKIARIDGVDRLAWNSSGVFFRPLALGDRGEDVAWLKEILADKGYAQSASNSLDWPALSGIRKFAASLGVEDSGRIQAFDPGWLVFLPEKTLVLAEVDLAVAAPAPGAGIAIAKSTLTLESAALLAAGTLSTPNGEDNSSLTTFQLEEILATSGVVAEASEELRFAGDLLELDDSRQWLDAAALAFLSDKVNAGTVSLIAQLGRQPQDDWWMVPGAALSFFGTTSICIERDGQVEDVPVTVVSGDSAGTVIQGALETGDSVRVPALSAAVPCQ